MHKCDIKQQFLTSRAARHLSRVCRGPFRRLRFAITETHSTYLQTFIGTLQCLPLSYPDAPGEVWKSFFCNSVCSHLRGNAGLVLVFCSSWWPIKMECKNVHPNQSDLIQGPPTLLLPIPISRSHRPPCSLASRVFQLPVPKASHREQCSELSLLLPSPSLCHHGRKDVFTKSILWLKRGFFFFIPRRNFSRRIKVFALKNCSSRDCAYFGQLPRRWVKLPSSLLTFECAILGPMTRDFNASSASAPSHPLPLLYVYMLHNYRVVGIYHLFWAVSRKTHNTITSSYCLSQDN